MTHTLPGMLSVPAAAWLLGMAESTLYAQVREGRDDFGGRKDGRRPRVQTVRVLAACGITRTEAAQLLAERDQTTQEAA